MRTQAAKRRVEREVFVHAPRVPITQLLHYACVASVATTSHCICSFHGAWRKTSDDRRTTLLLLLLPSRQRRQQQQPLKCVHVIHTKPQCNGTQRESKSNRQTNNNDDERTSTFQAIIWARLRFVALLSIYSAVAVCRQCAQCV